MPGRCHQQPAFVVAALTQRLGHTLRVFAGGARALLDMHTRHVQALLSVELRGQLAFGHTRGEQAPFTTAEDQLQLRMRMHPADRHRHTLYRLAQRHLSMRLPAGGVLQRTTQHNHASMLWHTFSRRYGIAVFQRPQQSIWPGLKTQQPQHHQPCPQHAPGQPGLAAEQQQGQQPPQSQPEHRLGDGRQEFGNNKHGARPL